MRVLLLLTLAVFGSCRATKTLTDVRPEPPHLAMPSNADETFAACTVTFDSRWGIREIDGPIVQTDVASAFSFLHCGTTVAYEHHEALRATGYSLVVTLLTNEDVTVAEDRDGSRYARVRPSRTTWIGRDFFAIPRERLDAMARDEGLDVRLFDESEPGNPVTTVRFPPDYVAGFLKRCDAILDEGPRRRRAAELPAMLYYSDRRHSEAP